MENYPKLLMLTTSLFFDNKLSKTDIILYSLICVLSSNPDGRCFAKNEYFCKLLNSNERTVRYSLQRLKKNNYIIVQFENQKRFIKPTINVFIELHEKYINNQISLFDYDWLNEINNK